MIWQAISVDNVLPVFWMKYGRDGRVWGGFEWSEGKPEDET
jgi:hypothetical protein